MTRALDLPAALRDEGVTVQLHPGWDTRGSSTFTPGGVVCHHTAGPAHGNAPSLRVCVDGRPDVPGPLANVVLARDGTAIVIASGRANHAGRGSWRLITGNSLMFGIEAENTGLGEPWPSVQLDAYVRCCAAMARRWRFPVEMVCAHREWAPGRKIDPTGIDMDDFRARVATRLGRTPTPAPAPVLEEQFMPALTDAEQRELLRRVRSIDATAARKPVPVRDPRDDKVWIIDGDSRWHVPNSTVLNVLIFTGQVQGFGTDGIARADPTWLDPIPVVAAPA